jgi:hypothetical protein
VMLATVTISFKIALVMTRIVLVTLRTSNRPQAVTSLLG